MLYIGSGESQEVRESGGMTGARCGKYFPLPDGSPAECDPDGENSCCRIVRRDGRCGNTDRHCSCTDCVDYSVIYREWRESGGKIKWRYDGRCGRNDHLPDGSPAECDPDGENPCCNGDFSYGRYGKCGNTIEDCSCQNCVDYRVVDGLRKSGENCTVTIVRGFFKNVCFSEKRKQYYFKCTHSDGYFEQNGMFLKRIVGGYQLSSVSTVCENDPHVYQVCGFNTKITNTDVLCGGFLRDNRYIKCDKNCRGDKDPVSQIHGTLATWICNDKCEDTYNCIDESDCNGYKYGVNCTRSDYYRKMNKYIPVHWICTGGSSCHKEHKGEDNQDCNVTESTPHTCTHYASKVWVDEEMITVPILNYTRCSVFNITSGIYPYCLNYIEIRLTVLM